MARARRQTFDHLSPREREVVGSPDEYDWNGAIDLPAPARSEAVQFSLRAERVLVERLQAIARERATTFSDVAREALERYAQGGGRPALSNVVVSFPSNSGVLLQVEGRRAEVGANRRLVPPEERTPVKTAPLTF